MKKSVSLFLNKGKNFLLFTAFSFCFFTCINPNNLSVPTVINIAAIQGISVPATGRTPVMAIVETGQYTGTVTWSPPASGTFATSTQYRATITLKAKSGYTLQGIATNFFTVAGATSTTNAANSGVITATFPATSAVTPTIINIAAIPGVTAPATGNIPAATITETTQYTGTVTWLPVISGTFAASTQYTATITLTAKSGYTLQGVASNFFTVAGATSATNAANSGVITATFPATAASSNGGDPDHTHVWGNWIVTTPSTAINDGEETRTCIYNSQHKETRAIPATSSNGGDPSQPPSEITEPTGETLAEKLQWLQTNARSNTSYILEVNADESLDFYNYVSLQGLVPYQNLSYPNMSNITITLKGIGGEKRILASNGKLFMIGNGVTLILDNNITIESWFGNSSLIDANSGSTLIMNKGAKISGKIGRCVSMSNDATFIMEGGEISGDTGGIFMPDGGSFTMNSGKISGYSSGVYIRGNGTFIMNNGEISVNRGVDIADNVTFTMNDGIINGNSDGVFFLSDGNFTMYGGEIYGGVLMRNTTIFTLEAGKIHGSVRVNGGTFTMNSGEISDGFFWGVEVGNGTFAMNGGKISGNNRNGVWVSGGGLFTMNNGEISDNTGTGVSVSGTFIMTGGEISRNTITNSLNENASYGGGVYVGISSTFTMEGGKITGNTVFSPSGRISGGGGVCNYGTFTMTGGEISGNTVIGGSVAEGGGVYVAGGTFTMDGGIISGNTADGSISRGGGVYVNSGSFDKTNGTIYGYSASDTVNSNVVKNSGTVQNGQGHAVYADDFSFTKRKETTAGPNVNLSFNGRTNPTTFSGGWDN
jgi:hypothetical protein